MQNKPYQKHAEPALAGTSRTSLVGPALLGCRRPSGRRLGKRSALSRPTSRDDSLANGIKNQLRRTMQIQLLQNIAAVRLHRMQTKVEHSRDALVRLAFRQQLQHLPLAGSKQLIAVVHLALP